jgi:hypothetical protein
LPLLEIDPRAAGQVKGVLSGMPYSWSSHMLGCQARLVEKRPLDPPVARVPGAGRDEPNLLFMKWPAGVRIGTGPREERCRTLQGPQNKVAGRKLRSCGRPVSPEGLHGARDG